MDLTGVKAWVDWAVWLLRWYSDGVVDFSCGLLWWRLRVCPILYPLLSFICIWAISADVPFDVLIPSFCSSSSFNYISCPHAAFEVLCLWLPPTSAALASYSFAALY